VSPVEYGQSFNSLRTELIAHSISLHRRGNHQAEKTNRRDLQAQRTRYLKKGFGPGWVSVIGVRLQARQGLDELQDLSLPILGSTRSFSIIFFSIFAAISRSPFPLSYRCLG